MRVRLVLLVVVFAVLGIAVVPVTTGALRAVLAMLLGLGAVNATIVVGACYAGTKPKRAHDDRASAFSIDNNGQAGTATRDPGDQPITH